jgi:hypothetical protein
MRCVSTGDSVAQFPCKCYRAVACLYLLTAAKAPVPRPRRRPHACGCTWLSAANVAKAWADRERVWPRAIRLASKHTTHLGGEGRLGAGGLGLVGNESLEHPAPQVKACKHVSLARGSRAVLAMGALRAPARWLRMCALSNSRAPNLSPQHAGHKERGNPRWAVTTPYFELWDENRSEVRICKFFIFHFPFFNKVFLFFASVFMPW